MARPKGSKTVYFSKVKEAREAISAKALDLFNTYETLIKDAIAAQDFETASKGLQFLMEHMPKDEDGVSLLETSVDKVAKIEKGSSGPTIKIGIALGGVTAQKELPPAAIIDVEPSNE